MPHIGDTMLIPSYKLQSLKSHTQQSVTKDQFVNLKKHPIMKTDNYN